MNDDPRVLRDAVGDPTRWTVVLDFDGTLSPIVDDPDAAALADGAHDAITALAGRTDVVVLSGRHVDDLAPRVEGLPVLLCGGHGTEVRHPDGTREPLYDASTARAVLDAVERDLRGMLDPELGWHVEPKPASLAVHHRRVAPDVVDEQLPAVRQVLTMVAGLPPGFEVLDGKAVTELRPAGVDKGTAVEWIVAQHDGRPPLVLGDDVTDEDAFRAAADHDGLAVLVSDHPRPSAAAHRLADPGAVVAFLTALAG